MKNKSENLNLKKLSRTELLELLLEQNRQLDILTAKLQEAEEKLRDRSIEMEKVGSLAEAALSLNGVFSAAQSACEQYMENIKLRGERERRQLKEMEEAAKEKCEKLLDEARIEAEAIKQAASEPEFRFGDSNNSI